MIGHSNADAALTDPQEFRTFARMQKPPAGRRADGGQLYPISKAKDLVGIERLLWEQRYELHLLWHLVPPFGEATNKKESFPCSGKSSLRSMRREVIPERI
jgi:hypothetical protein